MPKIFHQLEKVDTHERDKKAVSVAIQHAFLYNSPVEVMYEALRIAKSNPQLSIPLILEEAQNECIK